MNASSEHAEPRRLIIHCGVQKTGSTSLHHFLARNRDALAGQLDVRTPTKKSATRAMGRASALFSLDPSADAEAAFVSTIQTVRDELLNGSTPCILSHENLPGAMIGRGGVRTLYPMITRILELMDRHLAPLLPAYVFYTRDMNVWKRSVYNQAVKTDGYDQSLQAFLSETSNCGSWADLEARVTAAVGPDRVRFFQLEDEKRDGRPGMQLLAFAGLSDSDMSQLRPLEGRRNESLNTGALEFLRLVNELGFDRPVRSRLGDLIASNQSLFVSG